MSVKLKDIAREAHVSISTVSRILSGDTSRKANDETIEKVITIAKELGYFEDKTHKINAQMKDKLNIGCIFTSDHESFVSPFFSKILSGIQDGLLNNPFMIDCRFYTFNLIQSGLDFSLNDIQLDGAIILGRTSLEVIHRLKKQIPHLVYCGVNPMNQGIDEVFCSAYEGVLKEIEYLTEFGHTQIGYIGPTDKQEPAIFNEQRYKGFIDGLTKNNLPINKNFVEDCYLNSADGYASVQRIYQSSSFPTAIVCANDNVALGALKALHELGINLPNDVSIVGFDNIEASSFTNPSLTTIDVPKFELGTIAVKVLLDRIKKGHKEQLKVQIPFSLVKRDSCMGVKK